jgi:hypothetical protein
MDNAQIANLKSILAYLDSIDIAEDPDTFEYLSGIRDQANRIMRDTIEHTERGSL